MPKKSRVHHLRPVHIRTLTVQSVADITPGMRRVVLGGDAIHGYSTGDLSIPGIISDSFDDDVRLVFPDPTTGELPAIELNDTGSPIWQPPLSDLFRAYTVRSFDADAGTLTIDFARHTAGLAEDWSKTAKPGDQLHVAGPKSSAPLPDNVEWMMFVGDDTALPAIGRALEMLPAGMPAVVVVQIREEGHKLELASAGEVRVHWVLDGDFGDACFDVKFPSGHTAETAYLWAAGEANTLRKVRAFAKESGFARENTEFVGYWRATVAAEASTKGNAGEGVDSTVEATAGESSIDIFHRQEQMLDIRTGIVVREAMALGVFEALTRRTRTTAQLAKLTGTLPADLERLLVFLESVGMLAREGDGSGSEWDLTSLSTDLSDSESYFGFALLGPSWEHGLALLNLGETLRSRAAAEGVVAAGRGVRGGRGGSGEAGEERAIAAFEYRAQWWIPQLIAELKKQAGSDPIRVHAEQAGAVVQELNDAGLAAADASSAAGAGRYVIVDPLATASAEQFEQQLAEARKAGATHVHVVAVLRDPQHPQHDVLVEDLSRLVRRDGQFPTYDAVAEIAAAAGWSIDGEPAPLDWETVLITLV